MVHSLGVGVGMALLLVSSPVGAIQPPLSRRSVLAAPVAGGAVSALGVTPLLVPPSAAGAAMHRGDHLRGLLVVNRRGIVLEGGVGGRLGAG